jgi:hypothetical protein
MFLRLYATLLVFGLGFAPAAHTCSAQKSADYKLSIIGFYNIENLFDTINDPRTNDEEFLPKGLNKWDTEKYNKKLFNMATVLAKLGSDVSPLGFTALGVGEVEDKNVLIDLCAHPLLAARKLEVVHYNSPDERGVDVGFIYNPTYFKYIGSKAHELALVSPTDGKRDYTRDALHVIGTVDGDTMHILVNHWPSRRGGEKASEWARIAAAQLNRDIVDSLLAINPLANIIIMGDLNDDPTNNSVLKTLRTKPSPKKMKPGELYNPAYLPFSKGNGTLAYRDSWNLFDQMILSKALGSRSKGTWFMQKFVVFRDPMLFNAEGDYKGYPFRTFAGGEFINGYSDHLPVYGVFLKKR